MDRVDQGKEIEGGGGPEDVQNLGWTGTLDLLVPCWARAKACGHMDGFLFFVFIKLGHRASP